MIWPLDYRHIAGKLPDHRCDWCNYPHYPSVALQHHLFLDNTYRKVRSTYACAHCAIDQPWNKHPIVKRR